jgi:hypothetical protein
VTQKLSSEKEPAESRRQRAEFGQRPPKREAVWACAGTREEADGRYDLRARGLHRMRLERSRDQLCCTCKPGLGIGVFILNQNVSLSLGT